MNRTTKRFHEARRIAEQRHALATTNVHERAMLQRRYTELLGSPIDTAGERELRSIGSMLGKSAEQVEMDLRTVTKSVAIKSKVN